jgi:ATP-binding cassette subfamily G (WHITE) protein 2 (PDR)
MYRVSPFTYLIQSMLATAVGNSEVVCAANEYLHISPPAGQTCAGYMDSYVSSFGGYLLNPSASEDCSYCQVKNTNMFLAGIGTTPSDSWRNFGLMWVYIVFNLGAALFLYWLGRVPKDWGRGKGNTATETQSPSPGKLDEAATDQSGKTSPPDTANGDSLQEKQQ